MTLSQEFDRADLERRVFNVQFYLKNNERSKEADLCLFEYNELKDKYVIDLKKFVERYEEIAKRDT